ncbi:MAG: hypothetical protein ACRDSJ_23555, partial [Rubrobacteraceae bacterium]
MSGGPGRPGLPSGELHPPAPEARPRPRVTEEDGSRRKPGEERLRPGDSRFREGARRGLRRGRPRDLRVGAALRWKVPRSEWRDRRREAPGEPRCSAGGLEDP